MQYYNGVVIVTRSFFAAAGIVVLFSVGAVAAQSPSDNIEVVICPAISQSGVIVIEPKSDSIVNEPKVAVNGTVEHISQIDFFIDDVYNNTVALGYSEMAFESLVTLSAGTHTIKLIATDSCSQTPHNYNLVVTYQPKTQPSVGSEVETEVGNVVINSAEQTPAQSENATAESIIDRFVTPPFVAIARTLDIVKSVEADSATRLKDAARSVLFLAGATLTFSAAYIGVAATLPVHLSFLMNFRRRAMGVVAIVGSVLMALVFML
jgi:hypothetical protein